MKYVTLFLLVIGATAFAGDIQVTNTPTVSYFKEFKGAAEDLKIYRQALEACTGALDEQQRLIIRAGAFVIQRDPCKVDLKVPGASGYEFVYGAIHFIK